MSLARRNKIRSSSRRGKGLIGLMALSSVGSLLLPHSATATTPLPIAGTTIHTMPYFMRVGLVSGPDDLGAGTPGTSAINSAVSVACNGGTPIFRPQWFNLPQDGLGMIISATAAEYHPASGGVTIYPSGLAYVGTRTGQVVSCGSKPVDVTAAGPLSLVAYIADEQSISSCLPVTSPCHALTLRMYSSPTTGRAPANDALRDARPIASLPSTQLVDTTYATPDGPLLVDYQNCDPANAKPRQYGSVWYRYSPVATGPVPIAVEPLLVDPNPAIFPLKAAWVELTAAGPRLVPRSGASCDSPVVLLAGHTYYLGVSAEDDAANNALRITGGPLAVRVGAGLTPSAPIGIGVSADDAARSATLTWGPPATAGATAITAYQVSTVDPRTGKVGYSVTLPATARSYTFRNLMHSVATGLVVEAVNASGAGTPVGRVVAVW